MKIIKNLRIVRTIFYNLACGANFINSDENWDPRFSIDLSWSTYYCYWYYLKKFKATLLQNKVSSDNSLIFKNL
jgi:hypothetical protein